MLNPNLSICVPSFHPEKIPNLFRSINDNFHLSFELIVCGPKFDTESFGNDNRIICIKDYGSPARCCNIAAERATGKYITFIADDATYLNMSIARAVIKMDKWAEKDNRNNHIVVCKYVEGNIPWWQMTLEWGSQGYTISSAYGKCVFIPDDWWHFNCVYYHTDYFKEMGGYDSSLFETPHWSSTDLAVRCQKNKCTIELMDEACFVVTHNPGNQGTHKAICDAHNADEHIFKAIYNDAFQCTRSQIPLDNWKNSPQKWIRR